MAPTRTRLRPDGGLLLRMAATVLGLAALYAAAGLVLVASGAEAWLVVGGAAVVAFVQLLLSSRLALAAAGARIVSPQQAPELHAIVDRLCFQSDMPKPRVAVADNPLPNAFALGRSRKGAVVCVTTGIMHLLPPSELEGVVAHELSHVRNRDVLVMTIVSFFISVALLLMSLLQISFRLFLAFAAVGAVFWAVGTMLMLALSRHREFVADRDAALVTGRPAALAAALQRVRDGVAGIPNDDLRAVATLNAFFIIPTSVKRGALGFFSTHPPLEARIERLVALEAQIQGR
ncbi:zinc metalloprotease HtpX [soil metagenome]